MFKRILQRSAPSLAMLSVLLFNQQSAYGQALNGSVVGSVRDTSEAVIDAAVVTLTNMDTGQSRETLTSSVGSFDFATVQPGAYQLRVNRNGFATHVQTGITAHGQNTRTA